MASALFTTSKIKTVSQDVPDMSSGSNISKKVLDSKGDSYKEAMSTKSNMSIKSDADLVLAKAKLAKNYADTKVSAVTSTIARNIESGKDALRNNIVTDTLIGINESTEATNKYINEQKKLALNMIKGVCGELDGLVDSLVGQMNDLLDQFTFNSLFGDMLNDFNLSGLMEAFSKCKFWKKDNVKQLASRAEELTALGDIDTYKNILKTDIGLPSSLDRKCKKNAIKNRVPGTTDEEHAIAVQEVFDLTGDDPKDFYKTTSTGISTEQLDISDDTFDLDKTPIEVGLLFASENELRTAHQLKKQYA